MRIKRDIGKGRSVLGGVLGILGGGAPPGSLNSDPISDHFQTFIRSRRFLENLTLFETIMVSLYPFSDQNGS